MYVHRSGFRPPHETMATHSRRRYRLTRSRNPDPNTLSPDESLWIIHYSHQADATNHFPTNRIQISEQVRHSLKERSYLRQHGQLVRKEFMLRDSANWPTINLPGNSNPPYVQQAMGYPGDVISHMNRSQQQAYMQQQQAAAAQRGIGPSPAKRPRHSTTVHPQPSNTAIPPPVATRDPVYEDEEGTLGQDYMDYLTPRDISTHRYMQHHEWLEEILNSQYDTRQIIPGELGLGRKGELESLTNDFFTAHTDLASKEKFRPPLGNEPEPDTATPRVGRLEAGKAEDFAKRASERVAEINMEMNKLKKQHARRMASLNNGRAIREAEQDLRNATLDIINGDSSKVGMELENKINQISKDMEAKVGKSIKPVREIECIQKGGLEEKSQPMDAKDRDYEMVDTFSNVDGAQPEVQSYSVQQGQAPASHTSPIDDVMRAPDSQSATHENLHVDAAPFDEINDPSGARGTTMEDWVMVNKDVNPAPDEKGDHDIGSFVNDTIMQSSLETPNVDNETGRDDNQEFQQGLEEDEPAGFDTNDFEEGIDFGDLNTAGDQLSGYAQENESAGLEDQGDLGSNENAFDDAFEHTDANMIQHDHNIDP